MVDKPLLNRKLERTEEHLKQIYLKKDPGIVAFTKNRDLQSIILFNLSQSIQACIDMGAHIISDSGWETPSTQADIFEILAKNKIISRPLAKKMIQMAGFRNRIVHEYEKIDLKIVYTVWRKHLVDVERFCKAVVLKYKL
ncbi:MAG: hypothetical protein C0415_04450 [Thermodesulfovibrio sp.]|nr:hypothetical protein [Thermodesulfovibrio sp.]